MATRYFDGTSGDDILMDLNDGGSALIYGGAGNDIIYGLSGDDGLDGDEGYDELYGGQGDDNYILYDVTNVDGVLMLDAATEYANEGIDTVIVNVDISLINGINSYSIGANIENLITYTYNPNFALLPSFSLLGNALNNQLTGGLSANVLYGYGGNDTLTGGGSLDELRGGANDDVYILDDATLINGGYTWDTVIENANEGIDTVYASADVGRYTYQLPANVENLTATGASVFRLWGNELNNQLIGNNADNVIAGYAGNDLLNGKNGLDELSGGQGNDVYELYDAFYLGNGSFTLDTVIENANEGIDTVFVATPLASITSYSLGANVENLTVATLSSGNLPPFSLFGNALNNTLTGNYGRNYLYGYGGNDTLNGGLGADELRGGANNDVYILDDSTVINNSYNAWDNVIENANEGTDTVYASADVGLYVYSLEFNVENLVATGRSVFNLFGNPFNNKLTGNDAANVMDGYAGNDTLDGKGGKDILTGSAGKDTLTGGTGRDRFSYIFLTDSLLASFDVIKDFNANTGNDLFRVGTARSGFSNVGTVATLDQAGIAAKLTTTTFAANRAAQFTFGTRIFVAINDAIAGFNATTDAIIEVTGLTGILDVTKFVTS